MKEAAPQQAIDSNYYWFEFTGQNYQQQFDPFSYEKLDEGVTLPNCQEGDKVCVIKALDDGNGFPIIHENLEDMIEIAITSSKDNDLVKVKL